MDGSRTARYVALFRALETARRTGRLFDDPYAAAFLSRRHRLVAELARVPALGGRLERYIDRRWPGLHTSAVVRTRLIDDLVSEALLEGAEQVVLLGAGYDSRAYRLPGMADRRVFEVDRPSTQAVKQRLLGTRLSADRRDHVRFVPADLIHDDLGTALLAAGYDPARDTVVVWEGVTNYLTEAAVDRTVRKLAALTPAGSRLIVTYVDRAVLDGTADDAGVARWRAAVGAGGEPWTFGFDPADLERFLADRGMTLVVDLSAADAARRYLVPLQRHEPAAPFYRIAMARTA